MAQPVARDVLVAIAESNNVCIRPLAIRRTDTVTGLTEIIDVPCGARMASKCRPCAEKARRLNRRRIREGWHLTEEPKVPVEAPAEEVLDLVMSRAHVEFDKHALMFEKRSPEDRVAQLAELDEVSEQVEEVLETLRIRGKIVPGSGEDRPKKVRTTRRRQDVVDLPKLPVDTRTIGKVYRGRDGKLHRPSTFLTVTLDSHGDVHAVSRPGRPCKCGHRHLEFDPLVGTPVDPDGYDYRSAALDSIHFARVLDRFWQNLRRSVGWTVQYAGAVELQKRLAPHAHFAVRGTMPRVWMREVASATYHQVWWPSFDTMLYQPTKAPTWDYELEAYCDPATGAALTTWDDAVEELNRKDAEPAYVVKLGMIDVKGIADGSKDAGNTIRYITKYLTKDLVDNTTVRTDPQQAHFDRLHMALSVLPCSPTCANWLLYGVQPDAAKPGLNPGRCNGKVHQRTTLGFTGRRVLVSRQWSGKTLADHRADGRGWVRAILSGQLNGDAATKEPEEDAPVDKRRYHFELARPDDPDVDSLAIRLMRAVSERQRWNAEIDRARTQLALVTATPQPAPTQLALAA